MAPVSEPSSVPVVYRYCSRKCAAKDHPSLRPSLPCSDERPSKRRRLQFDGDMLLEDEEGGEAEKGDTSKTTL
jgi:hypothetical protein